jgi:hypothetical protein
MSDCCLPNLGCLSIPVVSTNVAGTAGQNGAPGAAATIAVGTVTTVNPGDPATVTNVGTSGAAIFDFEIPEGAPGAAGVNGVSRLYQYVGVSVGSLTPSTWISILSYSLPANTLVNIGDSILINLISSNEIGYGTFPQFLQALRKITFGGISCTASITYGEPPMVSQSFDSGNTRNYRTVLEIIRTGTTTALCKVMADVDNAAKILGYQYLVYDITLSFLDFTVSNTISAQLNQVVANQIFFKSMTIDKITAA